MCVSAKAGVGLPELLDVLAQAAPAPTDIQRTATSGDTTVTIEQSADGPVVGQVFKVRVDPFVQKLSYLRLFSGTIAKDQAIPYQWSPQGC